MIMIVIMVQVLIKMHENAAMIVILARNNNSSSNSTGLKSRK